MFDSDFLDTEAGLLAGSLALQHDLGHAGYHRLVGACGSPEAVYAAGPEALRALHPRLSPGSAVSIARGPDREGWRRLRERCGELGILLRLPGMAGYPRPLEAIVAPPPAVFLRGGWEPGDAEAVALVGTRTPTAYGREAAFVLSRDFARAGFTVVSGLALGVDAAAHAGTVAAGGRTVAVIGCGLDIAYPQENLGLRARIEERGAVVSEFPPGTPAYPSHFPRRNRLISALARATVVIEAGERSGALITAMHARNQNKPLFAVPGPIFSSVSLGTHALLRRGAALASSAEDVIAALRDGASMPPASEPIPRGPRATRAPAARRKSDPPPRKPESDHPVLRLWRGEEVCGVDRLAERAREQRLWPEAGASSALLESLLQLELQGRVRRLPGAAYRRCV